MKKIIRMECHRALGSLSFRLALLCGLIITLADFFSFYNSFGYDQKQYVVEQAWIGLDYHFAYNTIFYMLLPLLASFAYAGSYFEDLRGGYIKNLILKTSRKKYFAAKYIVSFLSAGMVTAIPLVINLMCCMSFFTLRQSEKLEFTRAGANMDIKLFSVLYNKSTLLYCLLYILIDMLFAGVIAVFSICVADITDNLFSTVTIPFAVVVISGVYLENLEVMEKTDGTYSLMGVINPIQNGLIRCKVMFGFLIGLIGVSILWVYFKQRGKDIL